jgi:hypothetical protein
MVRRVRATSVPTTWWERDDVACCDGWVRLLVFLELPYPSRLGGLWKPAIKPAPGGGPPPQGPWTPGQPRQDRQAHHHLRRAGRQPTARVAARRRLDGLSDAGRSAAPDHADRTPAAQALIHAAEGHCPRARCSSGGARGPWRWSPVASSAKRKVSARQAWPGRCRARRPARLPPASAGAGRSTSP